MLNKDATLLAEWKALATAAERGAFVEALKGVINSSEKLPIFLSLSSLEKLYKIADIWKVKYPVREMLSGRSFFEDIMGYYRYTKSTGWLHTGEISEFFKGVDFFKGTTAGTNIFAETAVSMKTTIVTDVEKWLQSGPIVKNLQFLNEGLNPSIGLKSNGFKMSITMQNYTFICRKRT